MDGNNLDNQNPQQQPEQDDVSKLDKIIQNNPFVNLGQTRYENVQTQSMVMSTREEANGQLAEIEARNAEIARQQKLAEDARKAKKTGLYIIVAIIFIAIIVAGGWLIFNAILAGQKTVTPEVIDDDDGGETKYGRVEGYKCTSDQCEKVADIDEKKIIVRDANKFYIYNKNSKKTSLTTIASKVYHEITIFQWGNKTLAVLDPESGQSALYDITSNRQVTSFAYDEFYMDINSDAYKDMTNLVSGFIIARNGTSLRLIDLASGSEKIRSDKRVFIHDNFYFTYENDGSIRAYTDTQKQIVIIAAAETAFIKNNTLIVMKANGTFATYDVSGTKDTKSDLYKTINKMQSKNRLSSLSSDSSFYRVPANN